MELLPINYQLTGRFSRLLKGQLNHAARLARTSWGGLGGPLAPGLGATRSFHYS